MKKILLVSIEATDGSYTAGLLRITTFVSLCRLFFFFQAEDGIRDVAVTGVQTCALPICLPTLAVRRVGDHEVELARPELICRQRGLIRAADDVLGLVAFALEQQVGLADGVSLGVDLLPEQVNRDFLVVACGQFLERLVDRKSTRLNSSHGYISYAVFCL